MLHPVEKSVVFCWRFGLQHWRSAIHQPKHIDVGMTYEYLVVYAPCTERYLIRHSGVANEITHGPPPLLYVSILVVYIRLMNNL